MDWKKLYEIMGDLTPLPVDCGQLCQGACCQEWQEGVGVALLPGEKENLGDQEWAVIQELPEGGDLLLCRGFCERGKRPLFCRLFPLAAILEEEKLKIVLDEDGLLICPLVQAGDLSLLEPKFRQAVQQVWQELSQTAWGRQYLENYTQRIKSQVNDPWKNLFK